MKKIIILSCLVALLGGATVLAQNGGLDIAGKESGLANTAVSKTETIPTAVGLVLGQITIYLGIVFFLLMVYAGVLWMTSSGNDSKIEKAKGILISAVIGLLIVIAAYAIVRFVFSNVLVSDECTKAGGQCIKTEEGCSGDFQSKLCPYGTDFKCCIPKKNN